MQGRGKRRIWGQRRLICCLATRPKFGNAAIFPKGRTDSVRPQVHVPVPWAGRAARHVCVGGHLGHSTPRATKRTQEALGARLGPTRPDKRQPRACLCCPLPAARAWSPGLWQPGLAPPVRLPLGDIKDLADGRAQKQPTLDFSIADQVLKERAAGEQARRHELQQQG